MDKPRSGTLPKQPWQMNLQLARQSLPAQTRKRFEANPRQWIWCLSRRFQLLSEGGADRSQPTTATRGIR
ncbi:MAG: hypothetical protein HC940_12270 [Acaryochloris sp. SU_5_25]|nr:hypothetical protein [Acaryochloris sp. SU_5_25]